MARKSYLARACLLALAFIAAGCNNHKTGSGAANASSYGYFEPQFQTEAQFVVDAIVSDLAEQMYFAKFHRLPESKGFSVIATENGGSIDEPTYTLQIRLGSKMKELQMDLPVKGPIWSAEVYRPVAERLAQEMQLDAGASAKNDDITLIGKLTDGSPETIEQQNEELSEALTGDFTNPELHEKAALLLGAFALREHSGDFFEIRSPLSRITAHLVMAQFFRGSDPFNINGQMANAFMLTAVGNQAAALEQLRAVDTNDAPVAAMVRALNARNTLDYRELAAVADRTPFENIQWFYAMSTSLGTPLAWPKLTAEQKRAVDYVRLANDLGYSVEIGHELLDVSIPLEMNEIKSVYELAHPGQSLPQKIGAVLNQMPEHCFQIDPRGKASVRVIGWGQWSMFFQRELCHAIQQNFHLMDYMWGVHDEAKELAARCDQSFGDLTLYPFVRRFNCTDEAGFHKAVDDSFKLTVKIPQYVPASCWNYLCWPVSFAPPYNPNPNPHVNEWHNHNPLPGTVYDLNPRLYHPSLTGRGDVIAKFEQLHELAPYDRLLSDYIVKNKYQGKPTYDQAMALYHEIVDYSPAALRTIAKGAYADPARYERLMTQAAEMDPRNYYDLGDYEYQVNKTAKEDKAAVDYQKGYDADPDRVRAANYAEWLVRYYLKHDRKAKAGAIAQEAGEVYSFRGLVAQAVFFEEISNYDNAFNWYSKIEERYSDATPVLNFCLRYRDKVGDTRFQSEVEKRLNKMFPKGVEKVSLADFNRAPADGVEFLGQNALMDAVGLKKGDVIVAIYGIRVHNVMQYAYGRNLKDTRDLDLIVWQGGSYREVTASPPKHLFGVSIENYSPGNPPPR